MILSKSEIVSARDRGDILIEPYHPENVKNCSYDVTLGPWYWLETQPETLSVDEDGVCADLIVVPSERDTFAADYGVVLNPYDEASVRRMWGSSPLKAMPLPRDLPGIPKGTLVIPLHPGQNALCCTNEFIGGADRCITTMMKARSSIGRNQVSVCLCAGAGDIGYHGRWTLEVKNHGNRTVILPVGRRIAQLWFMRTTGLDAGDEYFVTGKYQTQDLKGKTLEELEASWSPDMMLPRMWQDAETKI